MKYISLLAAFAALIVMLPVCAAEKKLHAGVNHIPSSEQVMAEAIDLADNNSVISIAAALSEDEQKMLLQFPSNADWPSEETPEDSAPDSNEECAPPPPSSAFPPPSPWWPAPPRLGFVPPPGFLPSHSPGFGTRPGFLPPPPPPELVFGFLGPDFHGDTIKSLSITDEQLDKISDLRELLEENTATGRTEIIFLRRKLSKALVEQNIDKDKIMNLLSQINTKEHAIELSSVKNAIDTALVLNETQRQQLHSLALKREFKIGLPPHVPQGHL